MATFTPEELKTLVEAPMLTGLAVSMSDLGIVSTVPEAAALSREIGQAAKNYPANAVIQAAFSEEALKSVKMDRPDVKPEEVQSGALIERAIGAIHAAVSVLADKATPEEIQEYKAFVYHCGEAVANAAGSGLFGTGEKVSDKEAVALNKFKAVLVP